MITLEETFARHRISTAKDNTVNLLAAAAAEGFEKGVDFAGRIPKAGGGLLTPEKLRWILEHAATPVGVVDVDGAIAALASYCHSQPTSSRTAEAREKTCTPQCMTREEDEMAVANEIFIAFNMDIDDTGVPLIDRCKKLAADIVALVGSRDEGVYEVAAVEWRDKYRAVEEANSQWRAANIAAQRTIDKLAAEVKRLRWDEYVKAAYKDDDPAASIPPAVGVTGV